MGPVRSLVVGVIAITVAGNHDHFLSGCAVDRPPVGDLLIDPTSQMQPSKVNSAAAATCPRPAESS